MSKVSKKVAIGVSSIVFAALAAATPAMANEPVQKGTVFHHTKTIVKYVPTSEYVCKNIDKPIYGNVQKDGNAGEGALAGMIIGGLLGKGISGDDGGAAAGAVIGGIIGADKGGKPRNRSEIIGYETVRDCREIIIEEEKRIEVYSHSTIRFFSNGKRYVLEFQR